jgi:hypothetical protein
MSQVERESWAGRIILAAVVLSGVLPVCGMAAAVVRPDLAGVLLAAGAGGGALVGGAAAAVAALLRREA